MNWINWVVSARWHNNAFWVNRPFNRLHDCRQKLHRVTWMECVRFITAVYFPPCFRVKVSSPCSGLKRASLAADVLTCRSMKGTGVINNLNYGCTAITCCRYRVLLCLMAHGLDLLEHLHLLMLLVPRVLSLISCFNMFDVQMGLRPDLKEWQMPQILTASKWWQMLKPELKPDN